jgi:nucleoside-diphosphate-sugar epimerase
MRYLVTGGAGFLGAAICKRLLDEGDEPIAYDLLADNVLPRMVGSDVARRITVRGDVTDSLHLLRAAREQQVRAIIHLASPLGPAMNANPGLAVRVGCGGMANVLETARILGIGRVIWASSMSVYRGYLRGEQVANDAPYRPGDIYGGTKILNELLAKHCTQAFGVSTIGFRPRLILGEAREYRASDALAAVPASSPQPSPAGSAPSRYWRAILAQLIERPGRGLPGRVPYGDDVMNWLWVDDVARAFIMAARVSNARTRVFNLAGDVRTIREAVEVARRVMPGADITAEPGLHGQEPEVDGGPLERELGFRIEWRLEDQVRALVAQTRA